MTMTRYMGTLTYRLAPHPGRAKKNNEATRKRKNEIPSHESLDFQLVSKLWQIMHEPHTMAQKIHAESHKNCPVNNTNTVQELPSYNSLIRYFTHPPISHL
ncbi:hypothetical protein JTB14_008153 [Gonioctena quinquepunctata]|nr:hypothetical protein JTB14_008153 [Gonioctena quinquepunctata]